MIVRLKRGKAKPLWSGHPWVFSRAIDKIEGSAAPGSFVAVVDSKGALIGWGHHSPDAQIAVRVWSYAEPGAPVDTAPPDAAATLRTRLEAAAARRRALGLPSAETNAYRLVNSEGDRMPGVIVDVYGDIAVLQIGTPGVAALQDVLVDAVRRVAKVKTVHRRISADAARLESLPEVEEPEESDDRREVVVRENGVSFLVDGVAGQKTGFYLDQRDNRQAVARLSKGRSILDVCAFGAAFSVHALKGGASSAVAVDTSPRAASLAERNAELNSLEGLVFDRRDAFVAMKERAAAGERYGVVVLDPPKFAHGRRDADAALQKYTRLNELALRCLEDDGVLVTCSCSRHISAATLERAAGDAAQRVGKVLHLFRADGQASDHPTLAAFPEGRYLKVLYFQTSPRAGF